MNDLAVKVQMKGQLVSIVAELEESTYLQPTQLVPTKVIELDRVRQAKLALALAGGVVASGVIPVPGPVPQTIADSMYSSAARVHFQNGLSSPIPQRKNDEHQDSANENYEGVITMQWAGISKIVPLHPNITETVQNLDLVESFYPRRAIMDVGYIIEGGFKMNEEKREESKRIETQISRSFNSAIAVLSLIAFISLLSMMGLRFLPSPIDKTLFWVSAAGALGFAIDMRKRDKLYGGSSEGA